MRFAFLIPLVLGLAFAQNTQEFSLNKPISANLVLQRGSSQTAKLSFVAGQKTVRVQVGGQTQDLKVGILEGDVNSFSKGSVLAADFNFDGWLDLALPESDGYGGVNYYYAVYTYNPNTRRFVSLAFPGDNDPFISNPEPQPTTRTVATAYKSGPAWYQNSFRFSGSKPYLYQSGGMLIIDGLVEDDVLWLEKTFDPSGKLLSTKVTDDNDKTPIRTVALERLDFYSAPNKSSRTNAYIIKGDKIEVLEVLAQGEDSWVKIAYQSRTAGRMVRWVNLTFNLP